MEDCEGRQARKLEHGPRFLGGQDGFEYVAILVVVDVELLPHVVVFSGVLDIGNCVIDDLGIRALAQNELLHILSVRRVKFVFESL